MSGKDREASERVHHSIPVGTSRKRFGLCSMGLQIWHGLAVSGKQGWQREAAGPYES